MWEKQRHVARRPYCGSVQLRWIMQIGMGRVESQVALAYLQPA